MPEIRWHLRHALELAKGDELGREALEEALSLAEDVVYELRAQREMITLPPRRAAASKRR